MFDNQRTFLFLVISFKKRKQIKRPMSEWKEYKLGEIADVQTGPFGSQLHQSDYVDVGIPSIMPVNIGDRMNISTEKRKSHASDHRDLPGTEAAGTGGNGRASHHRPGKGDTRGLRQNLYGSARRRS